MDFTPWSPSHTLIVIITLLAFGGQLIAILTYLKVTATRHSQEIKQLAERIDKQGETFFHALERLEDRMDKRFVEVIDTMNQRLTETNKRIDEVNHRIDDVNQRLASMDANLRQLNQNHIDHLTHHQQ